MNSMAVLFLRSWGKEMRVSRGGQAGKLGPEKSYSNKMQTSPHVLQERAGIGECGTEGARSLALLASEGFCTPFFQSIQASRKEIPQPHDCLPVPKKTLRTSESHPLPKLRQCGGSHSFIVWHI